MSCNIIDVVPSNKLEQKISKDFKGNPTKIVEYFTMLRSDAFKSWYKSKFGEDFNPDGNLNSTWAKLRMYENLHRIDVESETHLRVSDNKYTSYSASILAANYIAYLMNREYYAALSATGNLGKVYKFKSYDDVCKAVSKALTTEFRTFAAPFHKDEKDENGNIVKKAKYSSDEVISNAKKKINELTLRKQELATRLYIVDENGNKSIDESVYAELNQVTLDIKVNQNRVLDRVFELLIDDKTLLEDEHLTEQQKNLYAMYYETRDDFDKNGNITPVAKRDIFQQLKTRESLKYLVKLDGKRESDENELIEEKDDYIAKANQHLGDLDSFIEHISATLSAYLSTIPVLKSSTALDSYDTDNALGCKTMMDRHLIAAVLYSCSKKTSPEAMIESIKDNARRMPNMQGLAVIANDMEKNDALKYLIYDTFNKITIPKSQLEVNTKNEVKYKISNKNASPIDSLRMNLINDYRYNSLQLDDSILMIKLNSIDKLENNADKIEVLEDVLLTIFPSISKDTVRLYCNKDGKFDVNFKNLLDRVTTIVNSIPTTAGEYNNSLGKIKEKYAKIAKIKENINKADEDASGFGEVKNKKEIEEEINEFYKQIDDIKEEIKEEHGRDKFTEQTQTNILNLANELINYTIVDVRLDSANVEGNNSSDVLNDSYITSIIKTLSDELASSQRAGELAKSNSFLKYSNLLFEHTIDGKVFYGIFREKHNEKGDVLRDDAGNIIYETTEYAKDLIKFALLDGVKNESTGSTAIYAKMNGSEYFRTAVESFIQGKENLKRKGGEDIVKSVFLMRIPSDAPKTFSITAPVYNINGLIGFGNKINTEHIVFNLFRNVAYGEIQNMANALGRMFVIEDGHVSFDNGVPRLRGDLKNGEEVSQGYDVYHCKVKDGKRYFFEKSGDSYKLCGRVFHSSKFELDDSVCKNFMEDIFGEGTKDGKGNGIINILYGRTEDGNSLGIKVKESDETGVTDVEFELTDAQKNAIDAAIADYIKNYLDTSVAYFNTKCPNSKVSQIDLNEFFINNWLMYNAFDELIEGNAKFYKSSQDFLKRAKEGQGSGISYGLSRWDGKDPYSMERIESSLDKANIVIRNNDTEETVGLRNGFRGVTILNTIRTSEDSERLFGHIGKKGDWITGELEEKGIISHDVSVKLADLYSGTKTNDAQSYITFGEWIRRITLRGQYPKYKELINRILDESQHLNIEDIQEFVQVQKNFYYDQVYDERWGEFRPRQIKNAEFVLVPRFIKGTDLEKVYDIMVKHGIDQLNTAETSKAGKKNVLKLWDNDGQITDDSIKNFSAAITNTGIKDVVEAYSYNYLYTQQEVAQHQDAENKFGIQIAKKSKDNIEPGTPLYEQKQRLEENYCANILYKYKELMKKLEIELDENNLPKLERDINGDYIIPNAKLEKFYELFREEALRTNADSNTISFFDTENGVPLIPPFLGNVSTKLESIIQSVFNNNITRQKLPGFHSAQVTGLGMSQKIIGQDELTSRSGRNTGNKLQFHPSKDGKIYPYCECLIPMPKEMLPLYNRQYDIQKGLGKTNEEAEKEAQKVVLKALADLEADEFIAYRIPTEGKGSVSVMKVVGFLHRGQGSTIIVPDDWVSQTGSDFDVDSIYAITKKISIDGKGKNKNYSINFDENEVIGRNNNIVDAMIKIFSDDATIEANLTPSNFKDIIDARDRLVPESVARQKKFRSPYNICDQVKYEEDAESGRNLKGVSVVRDNLCSICNTAKATVSAKNRINVVYRESQGYSEEVIKAAYPNVVVKKVNGEKWFYVCHSRFGWSENNKNVKGSILTSYSAQTTAHILDAIKEGNIPNVNAFTFGVYKTFVDMGSDYDTAISFMLQPAITRLVEKYNQSNSVYSTENGSYKEVMIATMNDIVRELIGEEAYDIKTLKDKNDKNSRKPLNIKQIREILKEYDSTLNFLGYSKNSLYDLSNTYFDAVRNVDRMNERGEFAGNENHIKKCVFDLITLLQFDNMHYLADDISNIANLLAADKFGAKVSIEETRQTIVDVYGETQNNKAALLVGTSPLLSRIYPNIKEIYNRIVSVKDAAKNTPDTIDTTETDDVPESSTTLNIYVGTGENSDLSNFAKRPFEYNGVKYNNVEAAFQAAKLEYSDDTDENENIKDILEKEDTSGKTARALGRKIQGLHTDEWDANSSRIMKELLKASFEQNPDAKQRLLNTGDAVLTHTQDNGKWGTEFPKLLMEVRGELGGIGVTQSARRGTSVKDAIINKNGSDAVETTVDTISGKKDGLTDADKRLAIAVLGTSRPQVKMASERTDPVFHSEQVCKKVNEELKKAPSERKFRMLQIMTKHDGIPLRNMLELKIAKSVHFSITSLGGTKYEPGVMKMDDMLDRIEAFVKEGLLNPKTTTIRIDPIIPGITKREDVRHIIERAKKIGIDRFKISILDSYGYQDGEHSKRNRYVISSMKKIGYDWTKFYDVSKNGLVSFNVKNGVFEQIYGALNDIAKDFGVILVTCAEAPVGTNYSNIKFGYGCLNVDTIQSVLGVEGIDNVKGTQRDTCSCYGAKSDLLEYDDNCASSCAYCYAGHSVNSSIQYYDEQGKLKDSIFTRTKDLEQTLDFEEDEIDENQTSEDDKGWPYKDSFIADDFRINEPLLKDGKLYKSESVYPSAEAFLTYATATSIFVEKSVFATENRNIRGAINTLGDFLGRDLTADEVSAFKKWYLAMKVYRNTNFLNADDKEENINQKGKAEPDEINETEEERLSKEKKARENEILRILGANNNKAITFAPNDVSHLTDEEKEEFRKLSPAQKVYWIKRNSKDGGIFERLIPNLYNTSGINGLPVCQTIQYNSDKYEIEESLFEAKRTWQSRSWICREALIDLFRYSIVFEGFTRSKRGVTQLILSDMLKDINFASNVTEELGNDVFDENDVVNYVRANWRKLKVPFSDNISKLKPGAYFTKTVPDKYKHWIFGSDTKIPTFITGTFNGKQLLYYTIRLYNGDVLLCPCNDLTNNENSELSISDRNNNYQPLSFMAKYAEYIDKTYEAAEGQVVTFNAKVVDLSSKRENVDELVFSMEDMVKDDPNSSIKYTLDTIKDRITAFSARGINSFYVISNPLSYMFKAANTNNALAYTRQTINGKEYIIKAQNAKDIKIGSYSLPLFIDKFFKLMQQKNLTKDNFRNELIAAMQEEGEKDNAKFVLLSDAIRGGMINPQNIFTVIPDETMNSSLGELDSSDVAKEYTKKLVNDSRGGSDVANRTLKQLEHRGVDILNTVSIEENVKDILTSSRKYIKERVEELLNNASRFYKDDDGNYHSLSDDATMQYIAGNKKAMLEWLKLYFAIKTFGENYNFMGKNAFDIDSQDPATQKVLKDINDAINKLNTQNFIKVAEEKFARYIISQSDDELLANEWFNFTNIGYHTFGAIEGWLTDAQEAPIPLMQVILHLATSDVRAKEMMAVKRAREFSDTTESILKRAAEKGETVNWDNIVDEDGNLIRDYNKQFVEDYTKWQDDLRELLRKGPNTVEYLKKKHEFEKWLTENVNREYVDEYYEEMYAAEDAILNKFPEIYAKYKELSSQRSDLIKKMADDGILSDKDKQELERLQHEIDVLTNFENKRYIEEIFGGAVPPENTWTPEEREEVNLNSRQASLALKNYITETAVIKEKYFNSKAKETFKKDLAHALQVIFDTERPDENGYPQTPQSRLDNDEEYKKAKDWLKFNARFVVDEDFKQMISAAFKEFEGHKQGIGKKANALAKELNAIDSLGVIDGRKFYAINPKTGRAYIEDLKENTESLVGTTSTQMFDVKKCISNAPEESPFVWSQEFWNSFPSGVSNPVFLKSVERINQILFPHYDEVNKVVKTYELNINELRELKNIYNSFVFRGNPDDYVKRKITGMDKDEAKAFMSWFRTNVDTNPTDKQTAIYEAQKQTMLEKYGETSEEYQLWLDMNNLVYSEYEYDSESHTFVEIPGSAEAILNPFLYGNIQPRFTNGEIVRDSNGVAVDVKGDERFMRWIDKDKTIARDIITHFTRRVPTAYYYSARREAYQRLAGETDDEYKERIRKWEWDNHYFNPSSGKKEALPCWTTFEYNVGNQRLASITNDSDLFRYEPRWPMMESTIKSGETNEETGEVDPDYTNHNFVKDVGYFPNFKNKAQRNGKPSKYYNIVPRNTSEEEMYKLFADTMNTFAQFDKARRYIKNGALPSKAKEEEHSTAWHLKQGAATLGYWYHWGHDKIDWQTPDYLHDYETDMPGLKQLTKTHMTKEKLNYPKKSEPRFNQNDTFDKDAYDAAVEDVIKQNREIEEHNKEIHRSLLDKDWISVMKEFIVNAGHYNAVQENKMLIYFGLDYLKNHKVYKSTAGLRNFKRDRDKSLGNDVVYEQEEYGKKVMDVYEAFCRRFVFNQFKKDQGYLTNIGSVLQQWSSAKYMMLNLTGGISNITYGETQIMMEAFANEYFNKKEWGVGKALWIQSAISFGANMYSDKATELGDGLCKLFNTLEFDKITELHDYNPSASTKWKRLREAPYCLQTIGEHFMQNGALLTMLASHRIYKNSKGKWVATSEARYIRDCRLKALKEILGNDYQQFEQWVKSFSDNPNEVKDYYWRKKDLITEYVMYHLPEEKRREFVDKRKELEKNSKDEFEKLPILYDQFELRDGYAEFKQDSILNDRNVMTEEEAYNILGCMKNKVISVNKKIHGVYDKLGASVMEQEWWGGLVMQYHKHIWPGIMKRWRRKAYYNEDRQTVEKGTYISLIDFLNTPYREFKGEMPDTSILTMTGIQNYFRQAVKFLTHMKLYYDLLPDYERANIRRVLGEICAYGAAVAIAVALKIADDDDDYKDNFVYNLAVYTADRLSTELEMYTPRGAMAESKKLWSQPIAANSGINDIMQCFDVLGQMLLQGEDYNPNYKSGPYYGQNKAWTLLTRQFPIYRSTSQVWRLPKNNKYYKRQASMASDMSEIIIKAIED